MANTLDVIIKPLSDKYNENDERWTEQVDQLLMDCKKEVGEIRKEVTPLEGQKGGLEDIFVMISSSKALEMAFDLFKSWILRDKTRSLKLQIKNGSDLTEFELSGKGFNKKDFEKYMALALKIQSDKNE